MRKRQPYKQFLQFLVNQMFSIDQTTMTVGNEQITNDLDSVVRLRYMYLLFVIWSNTVLVAKDNTKLIAKLNQATKQDAVNNVFHKCYWFSKINFQKFEIISQRK